MAEPINIFVVDDHQMVREGIISVLKESGDIKVLGEASNGKDALEKLDELSHQSMIVLMDINMPVMDGISCTAEIYKRYNGEIPVIALSMMNQSMHIRKMLQAGAVGYLLKDCDKNELYRAINKVAAGDTYFSNSVSLEVMNEMTRIKKSDRMATEVPLSKRELEVLELIVHDHSNQAIADKLHISVRTVESHKQNLLAKSGAQNVAGLVVYAIKNRLVDV